jgi:hypothetical protein
MVLATSGQYLKPWPIGTRFYLARNPTTGEPLQEEHAREFRVTRYTLHRMYFAAEREAPNARSLLRTQVWRMRLNGYVIRIAK